MATDPITKIRTLAASNVGVGAFGGNSRPSSREVTPTGARSPKSKGRHGWLLVIGLLSFVCVGVAIGGRELLQLYEPWRLAQWEHLLRKPIEQQITGFVMLGLLGVGLLLPVVRSLGAGRKKLWAWRTVHGLVGTLAVAGLIAHTGLRFGSNLNLWLTVSFLLLCGLGAFCSTAMGGTPPLRAGLRQARRLHVVLFWPVLALIGLHVLASYYF